MAVSRIADGKHQVIAVGPESPGSRHDRFVLNTVRARADALITTGAILRSEPQLTGGLLGTGPEVAALQSWRASSGRSGEPTILVLTSGRASRDGRSIDPDHPMLREADVVLFTGHRGAETLWRPMLDLGVEVVSHEQPSVAAARDYLVAERQASTIALEAGPRTSVPLYHSPSEITELYLSVFEGMLPPTILAGAFLSPEDVLVSHVRPAHPVTVSEPSGDWTFHRFVAGQ